MESVLHAWPTNSATGKTVRVEQVGDVFSADVMTVSGVSIQHAKQLFAMLTLEGDQPVEPATVEGIA